MRISDWSSDVCSSDLDGVVEPVHLDPAAALQPLQRTVNKPIDIDLLEPAGDPGGESLYVSERKVYPRDVSGRFDKLRKLAEIGRASCRERVCQYVYILVVRVSLKTKN